MRDDPELDRNTRMHKGQRADAIRYIASSIWKGYLIHFAHAQYSGARYTCLWVSFLRCCSIEKSCLDLI